VQEQAGEQNGQSDPNEFPLPGCGQIFTPMGRIGVHHRDLTIVRRIEILYRKRARDVTSQWVMVLVACELTVEKVLPESDEKSEIGVTKSYAQATSTLPLDFGNGFDIMRPVRNGKGKRGLYSDSLRGKVNLFWRLFPPRHFDLRAASLLLGRLRAAGRTVRS
jgi:hypothetical protein